MDFDDFCYRITVLSKEAFAHNFLQQTKFTLPKQAAVDRVDGRNQLAQDGARAVVVEALMAEAQVDGQSPFHLDGAPAAVEVEDGHQVSSKVNLTLT